MSRFAKFSPRHLREQAGHTGQTWRRLGWTGFLQYRMITFRNRRRPGPDGACWRLRARGFPHAFEGRWGTSDVEVFKQVIVQEHYEPLVRLHPASGTVRWILDGGANVGYSTVWLLTRFPNARVVAVEPDPSNFQRLKAAVAPYADRAILVQGAIWPVPGTLHFDTRPRPPRQEWAIRVQAAAPAHPAAAIEAWPIPRLASTFALAPFDIVKLDVEGAETAIFGSGDRSWISSCSLLAVELHGLEAEQTYRQALVDFPPPDRQWQVLPVGEISFARPTVR